ncbi:hypothetical protein Pmani_001389 [Petrolisthes manimaculis]|uniref:Uncharacterized protein n=1 Tax=Petrolisthes manimaculis TaxID=1843537 RepID=A0AAE1QN60_9EUCA|nr:hypothetical protein Pmani_001389 [Petrolisthes manimaculis]
MPPLTTLSSLETFSVDALTSILTLAMVRAAGGGPSPIVRKLAAKSKKAKKLVSRAQDGILVSHGSSQVLRVKNYLGQAVPKDRREKLFHQVLLQVVESMTLITTTTKKRNITPFTTLVQKVGKALSYSLEILFYSNVAKLDLTPLIHHMMKWVSTCKLNNRNPKETNEIDNVRVENMLIKTFGEHAQKMSKLTTILWPHLVSSEVIRIIGRHCTNLRRLELACKCDASAAMNDVKEDPDYARRERELVGSLGAIYDRAPGDFTRSRPTGCPKLQILVLPRLDDEDGALAGHITQALCSLQDLEQVIGVPMLVSVELLPTQRNRPQKLNLRLLSDIDTYNRRRHPDLTSLTTLLPRLESLEIIASQVITKNITQAFIGVKNMKIAQPDLHLNIKQFKYLDTLDINLEFQIAWPLLSAISKSRIPLTDLTLRHSTFQMGQQDSVYPALKLGSLKSLTLVRSSFIEYNAFKNLALGAPNLTSLAITLTDDRNYTVDEFKDDLVCVLSGILHQLSSFTAECQYKTNLYNQPNCLLTMMSVNTLLVNCPQLTFLGHLDVWSLDDSEVNELNHRIRINNWDLQVV